MAQSEYLRLERGLRPKQPEEHPPDQVEQILHRAFIARFGASRQADGIYDSDTGADRTPTGCFEVKRAAKRRLHRDQSATLTLRAGDLTHGESGLAEAHLVIRLGGRRSRRAILHGVRPFIPWALLVNCRPASAALRQKRKFAAKPSSTPLLR